MPVCGCMTICFDRPQADQTKGKSPFGQKRQAGSFAEVDVKSEDDLSIPCDDNERGSSV